ncbi:MAG: ABC transporter ATP-binding protein [Candidatus Diapherotrites archaeon]|nr:ABC transporter ATP-binding protein [Candidatus Diapherotrites archaeon]
MTGLSIQGISVGYGAQKVLDQFSLDVLPAQTLVLMGPSGTGKSTLLHAVLGLVVPKEGRIMLNGTDITVTPMEKRNIGFLPQDYGLFPHLNVLENVVYGLAMRHVSEKEREWMGVRMLGLVELSGFENKKIQELSGGQRQRVALARALAIGPSLLLLDEPLSGIDQVTKLEVATQLKRLFQKLEIPVILVTHSPEEAFFFGEHVAILMDGKIVQSGKIQDVLRLPQTPLVRRLLLPFNTE